MRIFFPEHKVNSAHCIRKFDNIEEAQSGIPSPTDFPKMSFQSLLSKYIVYLTEIRQCVQFCILTFIIEV